MITPQYCLTMARYNAWQNRQLKAAFRTLDADAMTQDRGAFFGSILATANHLLWADRMWLARFTRADLPGGTIADSTTRCATAAEWEVERFRTDGAMILWAERLGSIDLAGPMRWHSATLGHEVIKPMGLCVAHMYNHQTHHRGQIHAMLSQAGATPPVSDLAFLPEDGPWP